MNTQRIEPSSTLLFPSIFFSAENKIPLIFHSLLRKYPAQDHFVSVDRIFMRSTFLSFAVFPANRCCHVSHLLGSICVPIATCCTAPASSVNCLGSYTATACLLASVVLVRSYFNDVVSVVGIVSFDLLICDTLWSCITLKMEAVRTSETLVA